MSDFDAASSEKAARNAALRNQIDDMLADLRRRTADIEQKQDEAAQRTFEVSSEDGMVTARVDATGTAQEVRLSDKAFQRTTPDKLAAAITSVLREAAGTAQRELRSTFAAEADTSNVPEVPGMPALQGLLRGTPLVEPPDPEAERARRRSEESAEHRPAPQVSARPDWDDDWDWDNSRRGGRR
ncbi:YbaB/EbfC family nucleoid-associated protein [Saccharopolyspora griseoalba]|uniref:YbaB/EbfC family nucleoid-associated protein n=1 Tax=Saccharopolyspora griseoalba TaxID=1431848 RepID=A0ABW2LN67_9PSEU